MRSYRGLSSFLYIVYSLFRLAINLVREPIARPAPLPMVGKQLLISCLSLVIRLLEITENYGVSPHRSQGIASSDCPEHSSQPPEPAQGLARIRAISWADSVMSFWRRSSSCLKCLPRHLRLLVSRIRASRGRLPFLCLPRRTMPKHSL